MAWCRQATSHYLSQCWPRSVSPYGVTRPQWVNSPHCCLNGLFPVQQGKLDFHLLDESRQEIWNGDHCLIHQLQGTAEVTTHLEILCFAEQGIYVFLSIMSVRKDNLIVMVILINPSCTEFISRSIKLYLHFYTLYSSDAGDGIFQLWRSIPCLQMQWLLKLPDHQHTRYWLCRTDNMYCRSGLNHLPRYLG